MWSPKQNKNWLKRDAVKQTGVGKIRGKTNLVSKTKKNYVPFKDQLWLFYHIKYVFKIESNEWGI